MANQQYDIVWVNLTEQLKKLLLPEDFITFTETFTLVKAKDNRFILGYHDKAAYEDFAAKHINVLMLAASNVCSRMADVKFRYLSSRETEKTEAPVSEEKKSFGERRYTDRKQTKAVPRKQQKNYKKGIKSIIASFVFMLLALAIALIAVNYIANLEFKENFYSITVNNIYEDFRVIQISDLHNTSFGDDNDKLIHRVEMLCPDLIVMTGDCIDENGSVKEIQTLCESLADIAPTYYIFGNNENKRVFDCDMTLSALDEKFGFDDSNRDPEKLYLAGDALKKQLESCGVKVLFNEFDTLQIGANRVRIFGTLTSNPSAFWQYAGEAFNEYLQEDDEDVIRLFLCHEPLLLETLEEETWGDIVFCGDTHGGVVRLPIIGAPYSRDFGLLPELGNHMIYGKYQLKDTSVIVSSGLSNKGLTRIFNQPELVIADINTY